MTPTPIKYTQVRTLRSRGPVDQEPDREVDGVLLVGDRPALEFEDRHSQAGCDAVTIYPAFTGAEPFQCWLVHRRWHAAHGYSASGVQENVIPFAQGVQIFLERGVFTLILPTEQIAPAPTLELARSIIKRHLIAAQPPLESITLDEVEGANHLLGTQHGTFKRVSEVQDAVTADLTAAGFRISTTLGSYGVGSGADISTLSIRLFRMH